MLVAALYAVPAHASGVNCSLAATSLAFGQYVPFSSLSDDVTATITVTCNTTSATPVSISATISLTSVSTSYGRQLTDGMYILRYSTYLDSARTMFWGDGTGLGGTETVSGSVSSGALFQQSYTVYGRILARQSSAHVGPYTDLIIATLNY
jgi:spore coat protein U-like protein